MITKQYQTGPFALTPERKSVADYSSIVFLDKAIFIIGLTIEDDPWALLTPFEWEVWLGISLMAPIFWFSAGIIDMVYIGEAKWGNLAFLVYGVMVNQVTGASQQTMWYKRFHSFVWVWGCVVFTKLYSGA